MTTEDRSWDGKILTIDPCEHKTHMDHITWDRFMNYHVCDKNCPKSHGFTGASGTMVQSWNHQLQWIEDEDERLNT